jgi:hypothetical protein
VIEAIGVLAGAFAIAGLWLVGSPRTGTWVSSGLVAIFAGLLHGPLALVLAAALIALAWWRKVRPHGGVVFGAYLALTLVHGGSAPAAITGDAAPTSLNTALREPVTPDSWAQALLGQLGIAATSEDVRAIVAWERAEGGHWSNSARFNPLNTTQQEPGSAPMNSVGVQAYTSWDQGLAATVQTLKNGRYEGVLVALRQGQCAPCVASAVGASPWGTGRFPT